MPHRKLEAFETLGQYMDLLLDAIGDQVLHAAAQRLLKSVRSHDTVARIGGDEFVLLLERVQTAEDASKIAEKVLAAFEAPIELKSCSNQFKIGASIGIALSTKHGCDIELLLQHADNAMYKAKQLRDKKIVIAS